MGNTAAGEQRAAVATGFAAYIIWGLVPLAIQAIARQGPLAWEILGHRIVWGALSAAIFVAFAHQWTQVARVLREPKTMAWLTLSSALIAVNWIVYITAVNSGRVMEASLGYYINPLVNMAAGALLFREKISRVGWVAMILAAIGVLIQGLAVGHIPWMALALAFSFGGYGIVRKRVAADAQTGLFIECLVLGIPSLAYILWLQQAGGGHFFTSATATGWLIFSGPVTAVPLAMFAWAARRIPLSAMGFLQFIAPTIAFFIGLMQGEVFTAARAVSFVFIWAGAAVFIWGAVTAARTAKLAVDKPA